MLPKTRKLTRQELSSVYKQGAILKNRYFQLKYLPNTKDFSRFAVIVSTKIHPKSHRRNRTRRLIYSLVSDYSTPNDIVIYLYPQVVNLNNEEIRNALHQVLSKNPLV